MYISKFEGEIRHIKHPINSPYSYAVTKEARGLVHHLIFPKKDGIGISIRDKVVADIGGSWPNCVSIVRDGATHMYVLGVTYNVVKH